MDVLEESLVYDYQLIDLERLTPDVLKLRNPKDISVQIEAFIKKKVEELNRRGVILGLSGGIDSVLVAFLCVRALGPEKVFALYMSEKDSKAKHKTDAERIAEILGINFEKIDLTPILETIGIYKIYPMNLLRLIPNKRFQGWISEKSTHVLEKVMKKDPIAESRRGSNKKFIAGGNAYVSIKHRLRMIILNFYADRENLMTVGAANQTEFLTGVFVKFGIDGVADLMPILPLFKVQVRQLAEFLGIPNDIVQKPADPDVVPGFSDKGKMFEDETVLDLTLLAIIKGFELNKISEILEIKLEYVKKVKNLMDASRHMRESPYVPELKF
jgi:NAD+ synthase